MLPNPFYIVQNKSEHFSQLKGRDIYGSGSWGGYNKTGAVEFDADAAKWSQYIIITFPRLPVFRAIFRGGRKLCPEELAHIQ
jgi:hypothetical protein